MREILRVGIIGTGRAGACHAMAFSSLPDVEVTALWNRTRFRAEALAVALNQPGIKVFSDWRDLIAHGQVDIISIATAPQFRRAPFAEALARHRHVLTEKPLSLCLSEAKEMTFLAQKAQAVTAISFNWRYSPGYQTTWRAVKAGQIGRPLDIRIEWRIRCSPTFNAGGSWSEMSGALREAGSHEFDRVRFLTGVDFKRVVCALRPVTDSATGKASAFLMSSEMSAYITAEMSDKTLAGIRFTATPGAPERRFTISGEEGTLDLSSKWVTLAQRHTGKLLTLSNEVLVLGQRAEEVEPVRMEIPELDEQSPEVQSGQHGWNRLIADFVTAVRNGDVKHEDVPHLPHISDGLAAQEVINACELSHAEERWVVLENAP